MIVYVPQGTPAAIIESIRSLVEGDGYELTAVLESADPEQTGPRVESAPDYSELPDGYGVYESSYGNGIQWCHVNSTGRLVYRDQAEETDGPQDEHDAIVAAWEDSEQEPPYLNDPEAQAAAFDIAAGELDWYRGIQRMRDTLQRNGYDVRHRTDGWRWARGLAGSGTPHDTLDDAVIAAWAHFTREDRPS